MALPSFEFTKLFKNILQSLLSATFSCTADEGKLAEVLCRTLSSFNTPPRVSRFP